MTNQKKYYSIRNKALANGLHWLTGQRYYIFDTETEGVKSYRFESTSELMDALTKMSEMKKQYQGN